MVTAMRAKQPCGAVHKLGRAFATGGLAAPGLRRARWPQELLCPVEKSVMVYLKWLSALGAPGKATNNQVHQSRFSNCLSALNPETLFFPLYCYISNRFLVSPLRLCRLMSFKSSPEISLPNPPMPNPHRL